MNDSTSVMGLPANELDIVAICVVLDYDHDTQELQTELDIVNPKLWENFKATNKPNRCGCCGHSLKHASAIVHVPTGNGYLVGRDCARKIGNLRRFDATIAQHTVALAQRLACDKRESDFVAAHPDALSILTWCRLPRAPKIAKDMIEKMRRYGNLSEAQIELLEKIRTRDEERRATATAKVVPGRQTIKGIVRKATVAAGFDPSTKVLKLLVDLGTGVRLYGNAPEYLTVTEITLEAAVAAAAHHKVGNHVWTHEVVGVGDTVEFKGTVENSKNDELFGFWKRPANFVVIAKAKKEETVAV